MILCDLTHAYTPTSGGIRTYIDAKRRHILDHTDHTHALIIPGEADRITRGERTVTVEVEAPFIPGAAPYRWFSRPSWVRRALDYVGADLVELGTFFMPTESGPVFAARRAARRSGRTAAVSIMNHTDFADAYAVGYSSKVLGETLGRGVGRMAQVYVRKLLEAADVAAAPSPVQVETFRQRGVDVEFVGYGVDIETFNPQQADAALRQELGIPEDAVFLSYAGRLDSEKRTDTMVEATERANETRPTVLVMAGEGPHRDDLESRQAAGAPIRVLPYQTSKSDLARLMASSDIYLTAGPYETFGLSVAEAQACGLPVVGVAAGALVERVPDGLGLLGPVDDVEAMASNILTTAEHHQAWGQAGREHVVAHHSWTSAFSRLLSLYTEALANA